MLLRVDLKALGRRLSAFRRDAQLTQEALADRAGISVQFLGNIERGIGTPSLNTLISLAHALELSPNDLLDPSVLLPSGKAASLRTPPSPFSNTFSDLMLDEETARGADSSAPFALIEVDDDFGFSLLC